MKTLSKIIAVLTLMLLMLSAFQSNAATFTVTNTNDTGAGSLRQAMIDRGNSRQKQKTRYRPTRSFTAYCAHE